MKLLSKPLHSALSIGAGLLSTAFLWMGTAQAQVSLSPMIIEMQSRRGRAKGVINITNTSNETFRARVYAEPFTYDRDKGFQVLESSPSNLKPYLQFSPRELVIAPGATRRVRLNARLAPNLPNGEYRTIIFTEPLKQNIVKDGKGNTTRIVTRVGSAFFVRKGDVSPNFAVDGVKWNSEKKQLQVLVNNSGKASAYPTVKWTLKQNEKTIKTGKSSNTGIVPQSKRNIVLNYSKEDKLTLASGKYQLTGELVWYEDKNKNKLPFKLDFIVPVAVNKK